MNRSCSPLDELGLNPLLEPLGPHINLRDIPSWIAHDPLKGIDRADLGEERREELLSSVKSLVVPTSTAVWIADVVQRMLRNGYVRRNPLIVEWRRRMHQLSGFVDRPLAQIPWAETANSATTIRGITGVGKSHIITRLCSLYPQVWAHGPNKAAGWLKQRQLVWLVVPMSHDGSRGGFLAEVLTQVDRALATDYSDQYRNRKGGTVERLLVQVGNILLQHHLGALIIEEIQPRNFVLSPHYAEMSLLVLRLLNLGIPIIMVGNPRGFEGLESHSQDLRRLTSEDPIEVEPAMSPTDPDWVFFVRELWRCNVMPNPSPPPPGIEQMAYRLSGGIPDFLVQIHRDAQRNQLRNGVRQLALEHWEAQYSSPAMQPKHPIIEGFVKRDPRLLSAFQDIPYEQYARMWGSSAEGGGTKSEPSHSGGATSHFAPSTPLTQAERTARAFKSEQTRSLTKARKHAALAATLPPDDLRNGGASFALARSFHELMDDPSEG